MLYEVITELDKTFCGREGINDNIVKALDEASDPWGIKVTRYEIRDITPTETIMEAMESQMRAERIKRASILSSEGQKQARINVRITSYNVCYTKLLRTVPREWRISGIVPTKIHGESGSIDRRIRRIHRR